MKSDEYYALTSINRHLPSILNEIDEEIENLDPSATNELKLIVAKLRGLENFVKGHMK